MRDALETTTLWRLAQGKHAVVELGERAHSNVLQVTNFDVSQDVSVSEQGVIEVCDSQRGFGRVVLRTNDPRALIFHLVLWGTELELRSCEWLEPPHATAEERFMLNEWEDPVARVRWHFGEGKWAEFQDADSLYQGLRLAWLYAADDADVEASLVSSDGAPLFIDSKDKDYCWPPREKAGEKEFSAWQAWAKQQSAEHLNG